MALPDDAHRLQQVLEALFFVEAAEAGLQTSTSELGAVIDRRSVNDLPLNGRNFTQLLNLTPGVSTVNTAQNASNQQFQGNPVGSFSFFKEALCNQKSYLHD